MAHEMSICFHGNKFVFHLFPLYHNIYAYSNVHTSSQLNFASNCISFYSKLIRNEFHNKLSQKILQHRGIICLFYLDILIFQSSFGHFCDFLVFVNSQMHFGIPGACFLGTDSAWVFSKADKFAAILSKYWENEVRAKIYSLLKHQASDIDTLITWAVIFDTFLYYFVEATASTSVQSCICHW